MSRFSWELGSDIVRDGWVLVLASHYYYNSVDDEQPIMSDRTYDALKDIVIINWNGLPKIVKCILRSPEDMKTSTYYVKLNKKLLQRAWEQANS